MSVLPVATAQLRVAVPGVYAVERACCACGGRGGRVAVEQSLSLLYLASPAPSATLDSFSPRSVTP